MNINMYITYLCTHISLSNKCYIVRFQLLLITFISRPHERRLCGLWGRNAVDAQIFECRCRQRLNFLLCKSIIFMAPESSAAAKKLSVSFIERQLISSSFTWKHSTGSLRHLVSSMLIISP